MADLIYGVCSSLQPGAGAEMCRGATVAGKWEKSGKILMTRFYFWINSIVKTPPVIHEQEHV